MSENHIAIFEVKDGILEDAIWRDVPEEQLYQVLAILDGDASVPIPAKPVFLWPTIFPGSVTQAFGINGAWYGRFKCGGVPLPGHEGIDMRASLGSALFCSFTGRVSRVDKTREHPAYGWHIRVEFEIDGITWTTAYAHMNKPSKYNVGDLVDKGTVLGFGGSTGNSTGPHLHFMLKIEGATERGETTFPCDVIDPTPYFKELQ